MNIGCSPQTKQWIEESLGGLHRRCHIAGFTVFSSHPKNHWTRPLLEGERTLQTPQGALGSEPNLHRLRVLDAQGQVVIGAVTEGSSHAADGAPGLFGRSRGKPVTRQKGGAPNGAAQRKVLRIKELQVEVLPLFTSMWLMRKMLTTKSRKWP